MIDRLRKAWLLGGFSKNVAVLAGGAALGQGAILLASPLLTRIYSPADFGVYAAAASLVSLLAVVTTLSYQVAIPLPESRAQTASLIALCAVTSVATTVVSGLFLAAFGGTILSILAADGLEPFLWTITLGQLGGATYQIVSLWAIRVALFRAIAQTRVAQGVGLAVLQLVLSGVGSGLGLIIGDVVGRTAGTARLAVTMWHREADHFRKVTVGSMLAIANRYRRFPIFINASSLLDTLGLELPILMLLAQYGSAVGGNYLLVARLAGLPTALIGVAASQVFFSEAARLASDLPVLRHLLFSTVRRLFLTAVAPAALGAVLAPAMVPVIFGPEWSDAGIYLTLLAPMFLLQFTAAPTGAILLVLERQDVALAREVTRTGIMVATIAAVIAAGLGPVHAVLAISIAGCAGYVVYLVASWYAISAAALR